MRRLLLIACLCVSPAFAAEPIDDLSREYLASGDPSRIATACSRLALRGNPEAIGLVAPHLKHPDSSVRFAALIALVDLAAVERLPEMQAMILDGDLAVWKSPDRMRRVLLNWHRLDKAGMPLLISIARAGAKGLNEKSLANPDKIRFRSFASLDPDDGRLRAAACVALGKLGRAEAADTLLLAMSSADRLKPALVIEGNADPASAPMNRSWLLPQVITSLGEVGVDSSRVITAIKKHQREFPVEVDAALRKLKRLP